jgi:polyphosphate kinase 2 (PPK2 family)
MSKPSRKKPTQEQPENWAARLRKSAQNLHVELVKLQSGWCQGPEGVLSSKAARWRPAGGTTKAITERQPGAFRVVALPAPTERKTQMYLQRYLGLCLRRAKW